MTVAQYMEHWLEDSARGDLAPRTYHNYRLQIRRHISPGFRTDQAVEVDGGPNPVALRGEAPRTVSSLPAYATSTPCYTVRLSRQ